VKCGEGRAVISEVGGFMRNRTRLALAASVAVVGIAAAAWWLAARELDRMLFGDVPTRVRRVM